MAETAVCDSTVSFAVTENMQKEKMKQCEFVELGDLKLKPRRIIHFSNGEMMEDFSTEEEENEQKPQTRRPSPGVESRLPWGPSVMFHMWRAATSAVAACDYVGERVASLLGLTAAKYQYAIDQHNRNRKEKRDEVGDVQVSEEAESQFEEKQGEELNPAPPGSN